MDKQYEHVIMLVDDEQSILKALNRLFRSKGYRILSAGSGRQGLEKLKETEKEVSLIISDQRMPEMTGAQFLEQAKNIFPNAIRFLLTGYSDMDAVVDAVNKGEIHRYLNKPWNDDDLLLLVQQALQQYELVYENRRLTELTQKQNKELNALNQGLEKKVEERTNEITQKNMELNEINVKLEKSFMDAVRLLSSFIQNSNQWLGKYTKNVAQLSRQIAEDFGVENKEIETIETAAMIHDIGLIGLPERVWQKDEKEMTEEEFSAYSHHPVIASVCLETVERLNEIGTIIFHHHEHFDGGGFPAGLQGGDIPLGARIIGPIGDYFRSMGSWPNSIAKINVKAQKLIGPNAKNLAVTEGRESLIREIKKEVLKIRTATMYDPEVIEKLVKRLALSGKDGNRRPLISVHYDELKVGMTLAGELRTKDGRFVLAGDTVLNKNLVDGILRLAAGKAIEEEIQIFESA